MDRFDSVQLGSTKADVCSKCGMHTDESNGCCHDEIKIVKIDDDQQTSTLHYSFNALSEIVPVPVSFVQDIVPVKLPATPFHNHSPPLPDDDLNILNCVFRI